jgi:hypothetical protein
MREAILRVDRRGLLSTIARMFSRVLIVLSELTETLGKQPFSRDDWWIRVNTRLDGNLHRSGKRLRHSSTSARELPLQKPYTKCMSQYSTWDYTNGILATQYTNHSLSNHCEYCITFKKCKDMHFTRAYWDKTASWLISFVEPKEVHHFQLPLSRKPFNFGHRCFGFFRYSLTWGTPSRSVVRYSCYTLYMCFMWISEQTAIISLYSIKWMLS